MGLVRGDLTVMAMPGDYGKPRPVLIVQSDFFAKLGSVVVVPLTTDLRSSATLFRIPVEPSAGNGLRQSSDLMVDKLAAVSRARAGEKIGHLEEALMSQVGVAMALLLGYETRTA